VTFFTETDRKAETEKQRHRQALDHKKTIYAYILKQFVKDFFTNVFIEADRKAETDRKTEEKKDKDTERL
jgi:hypothetical protein